MPIINAVGGRSARAVDAGTHMLHDLKVKASFETPTPLRSYGDRHTRTHSRLHCGGCFIILGSSLSNAPVVFSSRVLASLILYS